MLLAGGLIYWRGRFERLDMALDGPLILDISPSIPRGGFDSVIQLDSCFISPGFVDVHVHLRQPGFSYKETILTGTRAAARGGYTAVCAMPNLNPAPDSPDNLRRQLEIIARDAAVSVYPYGCLTVGERGERLSDIEGLAPDVIGFSDDGRGLQDRGLMREAMLRVAAAGSLIAAHCEDETLLAGGYVHAGAYARRHGHAGMNPASEYVQLERDLELVRDTGCRYHACHLSARESVELVRSAKRGGLPVSCEVTPHHLLLCDGDISDDGRFKMNPPLRSAADRRALLEGLLDGAIDMIATDHAPHSAAEKGGGLRGGAMGVTGLEAAFRVLYTRLVSGGTAGLELLADKMAASPGRLFGIGGELTAGGPADLCVITPGGRAAIDPGDFLSKGRSTPFEGMETEGDILMTIKGGQVAWRKTAQEK